MQEKIRQQLEALADEEYLQSANEDSFEEIMLKGMVIGCAKCSIEERLSFIQSFIPKINNWSVCDSFCASLKFTRESPFVMFSFQSVP